MTYAPQQDWSYYEARTREANAQWLRSLLPDERLAMYEDMFNIHWEARRNVLENWDKLAQFRWDDKVATRRRMVDAFRTLDELRSRYATATDVG